MRIFFLLMWMSVPALAGGVPMKWYCDPVADTVVSLAYNLQFDRALRMLDECSSGGPTSQKWEFFRAVVLWQKHVFLDSVSVADTAVTSRFTRTIDQVISTGERQLSSFPDDSASLFYTGFALGYRAKYDAANGDEFKAASDGNKGLNYHDKLLKLCPACYDAYYSRALFNYYTSKLPWMLKPLLFILGRSGSADKAYEYLTLTGSKGEYTKYAAKEILAELFAHEKKYDSSLVVYHQLISEFPRASLYYYDRISWTLMDADLYRLNISESVQALQSIEGTDLSRLDSLYLAKIYLRLGCSYQYVGDYTDARKNFTIAASLPASAECLKVAREHLDEIGSR